MSARQSLSRVLLIVISVVFLPRLALSATVLFNFESPSSGPPTNIASDEKQKPIDSTDRLHMPAETLFFKYLIQTGLNAISSNEFCPSKRLTQKEYRLARDGKTTALRKMAASQNASFFFNAEINQQDAKEDFLGVKMSTTVITISYKLSETATGAIIDVGSKKYLGTARTLEFAQHSALEKMAKDLAQTISLKLPDNVLTEAQKRLSTYQKECFRPLSKAKTTGEQGKKAVAPDISAPHASEGKSKPVEDKTPPEIFLIQPPVTRGFTVVLKETSPKTMVVGIVQDESPVLYVSINGNNTLINANGYFSNNIAVDDNTKKIIIEAMDERGNKVVKEFFIQGPDTYAKRGESKEAPVYGGQALKPALWGLSIGVSNYNSTIANLKYADKDAISLTDFFLKNDHQLYAEVHFKTLVNDDVTRDSIIENIISHLGQAAPEDVVFIFIAGHGIRHRQTGSYYFLPSDVDAENILSKGLRMSDFQESVNVLSKNVNKVVIAMDTCHAGSLNVNVRANVPGENLAALLKESTGVYILAASKSGEVSFENDRFKLKDSDSGHGAFTYALLEGMTGKANFDGNSYISLNELFQFVAKQVPRLTEGQQHPYFRSSGTDLPFVSLK